MISLSFFSNSSFCASSGVAALPSSLASSFFASGSDEYHRLVVRLCRGDEDANEALDDLRRFCDEDCDRVANEGVDEARSAVRDCLRMVLENILGYLEEFLK